VARLVAMSPPVTSAGKKSMMEAGPETELDEMEETVDDDGLVIRWGTPGLSSFGSTVGGLAATGSTLGIHRERPKSARVTI